MRMQMMSPVGLDTVVVNKFDFLSDEFLEEKFTLEVVQIEVNEFIVTERHLDFDGKFSP